MSTRLTDPSQIFFPVEMAAVYVKLPDGGFRPVPGKRAVVNQDTGRPVAVVGGQYQLVTNQEALELAQECCRAAFPKTQQREWEVGSVDAPGTGGHCRIDLKHSTMSLDFACARPGNKPDVYGPFVRVTNSYNGRYALQLVIGFMRQVCSNGMILPQGAIRISLNHNTRNIGDRVRAGIEQKHYRNLRQQFENFLAPLRESSVPRRYFNPILRSALKIAEPKILDRSTAAALVGLDARIESVCGNYVQTLGENGYGLMNAVTEFATNPPSNRFVRRERHSFQTLAGTWLSEFSKECRKKDFTAETYVRRLTDSPDKTSGSGGPRR